MPPNDFPYDAGDLMEKYLRTQLKEDEAVALENILKNDPALEVELLHQIRLDAMLSDQVPAQIYYWNSASEAERALDAWQTATESAKTPVDRKKPTIRSRLPWPLRPWADRVVSLASSGKLLTILLCANLFGIVLVIALMMMPSPKKIYLAAREMKPDAVIVASKNAVWEGNVTPTMSESGFTGWLHLLDGLTEIEFGSGVRAFIEGNTQFQVVGTNRAHCSRGRVGAMVSPAAVGFTVTTPHVTVVDLGTAFELHVSELGTDVFVLEGCVELRDLSGGGGGGARKLHKGETVRVSTEKKIVGNAERENRAGFRDDLEKMHGEMVRRWKDCRMLLYRGLSAEAPENTLEAFRRAIRAGADGCSMEVAACGDGSLVLLADNDLKRTTRKDGDVRKLSLSEVRKLDAGSWKGAEFAGEKIPTLVETLELFRNGDCRPYIEVKEVDHLDGVLRAVRAAGMTDRVVIMSASPNVLTRIKQVEPDAVVCWRFASKISSSDRLLAEVRRYGADQVLFGTNTFQKDWAEALQSKGVDVGVWAVDDETLMKQFLDRGVEFLGTNRPELLKKYTQ